LFVAFDVHGAAEPSQDPREVLCEKLKAKYDLDLDPSKITHMGRDGIDYDGSVIWPNKNLTRIPVRFRSVTGDFFCSRNRLTTLEHAPGHVGGNFFCGNNHLTTLEHAPKHVGRSFSCYDNHLPRGTKKPVGVKGKFVLGQQTPAPVHGAAEPNNTPTMCVVDIWVLPSITGTEFSRNLLNDLEHKLHRVLPSTGLTNAMFTERTLPADTNGPEAKLRMILVKSNDLKKALMLLLKLLIDADWVLAFHMRDDAEDSWIPKTDKADIIKAQQYALRRATHAEAETVMAKENWIQKAREGMERKGTVGALHRYLGVSEDARIPRELLLKALKDPKTSAITRKRLQFALNTQSRKSKPKAHASVIGTVLAQAGIVVATRYDRDVMEALLIDAAGVLAQLKLATNHQSMDKRSAAAVAGAVAAANTLVDVFKRMSKRIWSESTEIEEAMSSVTGLVQSLRQLRGVLPSDKSERILRLILKIRQGLSHLGVPHRELEPVTQSPFLADR
jgi:hypothetical protein